MNPRTTRWVLAATVAWSLAACGWFASAELTSRRLWDERFSVSNVENALVRGTLRPENGWYGRLSYLPQTAILAGVQSLHERTGIDRLQVFANGRFSASAYLISRWVSVLYGAGCLILTFSIGRRIFSSEVALVGTALLATIPYVVASFVTFKPDALVMLLVLATFSWSLDAEERPSRRSFLVAGLGVGLAVSAKYTGALAAFPVIAAALAANDGWRRLSERLAIAGSTSVAVFLLLHPDLGFYLLFLRLQDSFYSAQGSHSLGSMLTSEASSLLHWSFHGPLTGWVALAGFVALCGHLVLLHRGHTSLRLPQLALFLSFPLGFSIAYAMATSWPKSNNYLVIVPFSSLAAAWLLREIWQWLASRIPSPARRPALWLALAGLVLLEVWPANAYIYSNTVQTTTFDEASTMIRRLGRPLSRRTAVFESGESTFEAISKRPDRLGVLLTREVEALPQVPEIDLNLVDFEIFTEENLRGPHADFYERRVQRLEAGAVAVFGPKWFRVAGPARVLLTHPWRWLSPVQRIEWQKELRRKGRFIGRLPRGLRAHQPVSLEVRVPRNTRPLTTVQVGELEVPLSWTGWDEGGERYSTRRFELPAPNLRIRLEWGEGPATEASPRIDIVRWTSSRTRRNAQRLPVP